MQCLIQQEVDAGEAWLILALPVHRLVDHGQPNGRLHPCAVGGGLDADLRLLAGAVFSLVRRQAHLHGLRLVHYGHAGVAQDVVVAGDLIGVQLQRAGQRGREVDGQHGLAVLHQRRLGEQRLAALDHVHEDGRPAAGGNGLHGHGVAHLIERPISAQQQRLLGFVQRQDKRGGASQAGRINGDDVDRAVAFGPGARGVAHLGQPVVVGLLLDRPARGDLHLQRRSGRPAVGVAGQHVEDVLHAGVQRAILRRDGDQDRFAGQRQRLPAELGVAAGINHRSLQRQVNDAIRAEGVGRQVGQLEAERELTLGVAFSAQLLDEKHILACGRVCSQPQPHQPQKDLSRGNWLAEEVGRADLPADHVAGQVIGRVGLHVDQEGGQRRLAQGHTQLGHGVAQGGPKLVGAQRRVGGQRQVGGGNAELRRKLLLGKELPPGRVEDLEARDCAGSRGVVDRAQGQGAQMDGLARLVDRLVAAEQQAIAALQLNGRDHLVLSQVALGGHHQLCVALPVGRHGELHRGRAGGVGETFEHRAGEAGLAHLDGHLGVGHRLAVGGVVDDDPHGGLAAGGQRILPQHQRLLRVGWRRQLQRAQSHAEEEHGHEGDGGLAEGAQPGQQPGPQAGRAALLLGALRGQGGANARLGGGRQMHRVVNCRHHRGQPRAQPLQFYQLGGAGRAARNMRLGGLYLRRAQLTVQVSQQVEFDVRHES